jgi:hypothetical protein
MPIDALTIGLILTCWLSSKVVLINFNIKWLVTVFSSPFVIFFFCSLRNPLPDLRKGRVSLNFLQVKVLRKPELS